MRRLSCLLLLLLVATASSAGVVTRHFVATDVAAGPIATRRIAEMGEEAVRQVTTDLEVSFSGRASLVVYGRRRDFLRAANLPNRVGVVGIATTPGGLIRVDASGRLAPIQQIITHEVTHVVLAEALGPAAASLPRWFNEGLAEYESRDARLGDGLRVGVAISADRTASLQDLDDRFLAAGDQELAYLQAASLVRFLVDKRGPKVLPRLLQALRRTSDFDAALRQVTGWDLATLDREWQEATRISWIWGLLANPGALVFAAMAVLAVAAAVQFYRRRRRKWAALEKDETVDSARE